MFSTRTAWDSCLAVSLLTVSVITILATMLVAPVPLSLDGPSHMYGAVVMRHLFAGDALYRHFFQFGSPLIPNWLASVIAALISLPGVSRWSIVFMNALIVLLTAAALYDAVRRSTAPLKDKEQRFYVLTILLPLTLNVYIILGFWGFLISTDLCLIAAGLLHDGRFVARRIIAPLLVLLGFWAHPVPVVATALIPAAGYIRAMIAARNSEVPLARKLTLRFAADIFPWCVSGLLIIGFATVLATRGPAEPVAFRSQLVNRLITLTRPDVLDNLSPTAGAIFIAYVALLAVGAFTPSGVGNAFREQLSPVAGALLFLYFIVPDTVGNGSLVSPRVIWIAIVVTSVLAVSGALAINTWYLRACAICAVSLTVAYTAEYILLSRRLAPAVQELRSALSAVPSRSELLLLSYRLTPDCSRWPILEKAVPERHLALLETIPRQAIVLNDYEPATRHFPVEYRDREFHSIINEYDFTATEKAAWTAALDAAEPGTFVLSWGLPNGTSGVCGPWVPPPLAGDLLRHYELQYENTNSSRVQLWKRRQDLP